MSVKRQAKAVRNRPQPTAAENAPTLFDFEAACVRRDHQEGQRLLYALLYRCSQNMSVKAALAPDSAEADAQQLATRFSAAALSLLLDPTLELQAHTIIKLAPVLSALDRLIKISGFRHGGHALSILSHPTMNVSRDGTKVDLTRRCPLLVGLDSPVDFDILGIYDQSADVALALLLHLLSTKPVATPQGERRRELLLANVDRLKAAKLPATPHYLVLLSKAWMLCSYARLRKKHEVKRKLNVLVRDMVIGQGLRDVPASAERRIIERPKMLVISERIHSNHVQYRYFGQWFRQLRQRFELGLLAEAQEIDAPVRELFDWTHGFQRDPAGRYIDEIVGFAKSHKPDLIFYPSVGMRHWGIVLANLRLAPIQFTALGHSSSTFCPTIDYFVIEHGYVGDPTLLTEKLILLEDEDLFFERSPHYQPIAPQIREKPDVVRVALAANVLKLNPHFISICAEIARRSRQRIEFHIFPDAGGLELEASRQAFRQTLPGAVTHTLLPYMEYLKRISACDLSFSPWPFGGLHSVVDTLRQGIPVVAMDGLEPHASTDRLVLRRVGMPQWLLCKDDEGYISTALRLVEDHALRVSISRQALSCDIDRRLFGDASTPLGSGIRESVWGMYRHHERIMADPRQTWTRTELTALDR